MDYDIASRKIFIGGLSYGTDDDKLKQYFQQFGAVHDAVVMKDPISRRSRGFGFITYEHASFVDIALAQEVHTIDSRQVEAKRAVPRCDTRETNKSTTATSTVNNNNNNNISSTTTTINSTLANNTQFIPSSSSQSSSNFPSSPRHDIGNANISSNTKIFVGGLHYDTRDAEFRNYFEKYGKVLTSEVMFNRETHKSRGFGFVVYETEKSVDGVCAEKEHYIDGKLVEVKRAVPRSKIAGVTSPPQVPDSPNSIKQSSSSSLFNNQTVPPISLRSNSLGNSNNGNQSPIGSSSNHDSNNNGNGNGNNNNNGNNFNDDNTKSVSTSSNVSSYAAALKSGSIQSSERNSTSSPSNNNNNNLSQQQNQQQQQQQSTSFYSFDQTSTQSITAPLPHTHGLLSEPVNVTGFNLRNHAGSLSEIDMQNSQFGIGIFDPLRLQSNHHYLQQQQQQQQYLQDSYPPQNPANSPIVHPMMPSRHRAHTESFLLQTHHQQQQQQQHFQQQQLQNFMRPSSYQRNHTLSFASVLTGNMISQQQQQSSSSSKLASPDYGSIHNDDQLMINSGLSTPTSGVFTDNGNNNSFMLNQSNQYNSNGFTPQIPQSPSSIYSDHHLTSMSPIQQLSNSSNNGLNISNTWENINFGHSNNNNNNSNNNGNISSNGNNTIPRTEIERSISLGTVGWTPSSISSPQRRGFSDVGLTDISITFNHPHLQSSNHNESLLNSSSIQHQHSDNFFSTTSTSGTTIIDENNNVPSEADWVSLIDLTMGLNALSPSTSEENTNNLNVQLDYPEYKSNRTYSLGGIPITESTSTNTNNNNSNNNSSSSLLSGLMTSSNDHFLETGVSSGISELRLQAQEFIPQSHQQFHLQSIQQQQQQQWPSLSLSTPTSLQNSPTTHFNG